MTHETLKVTWTDGLCRIALDRPDVGNAINTAMVEELGRVLARCEAAPGQGEKPISVVVIEGGAETFCAGGDFEAVAENGSAGDPGPLYDIWLKLAEGPFVSVCLVKGRVNAGGVGFVAACDIVIAEKTATFALSELLFGLFPACVLPFLIRRTGRQRAHYMTLMTRPVSAPDALASGLVDVIAENGEAALRQHLARLRHLQQPAIARYKAYMAGASGNPAKDRERALEANREIFCDPKVLADIRRYVSDLTFPWED